MLGVTEPKHSDGRGSRPRQEMNHRTKYRFERHPECLNRRI